MSRVKVARKRPPPGFEVLQPTLEMLERKMRDAESDAPAGKKKAELMWPIFRVHHQRSRLVYEMFYRTKEISRDVYDYCIRERIADEKLIAKWKQAGYERLCCLHCVSTKDHNHGTTCVCRVPRAKLESGVVTECTHCGCRGCASGD